MPLPVVPITDPDAIEEIEQAIAVEFSESLGELDFADALPESLTPEQLDKVSVSILRYLLQVGEGGYKDGIDEVQDDAGDPPAQANGWLWDKESEEYRGRFIDRRPSGDRVFSFVIAKNGENWARSFSPLEEAVNA